MQQGADLGGFALSTPAPWPAASIIAPAPIWTDLHWPILLLVAAGVAQACVDLARPQQTKWRAKSRLAIQAAGLILLCLVLRAGVWVVMAPECRIPAVTAA